MVADSDVEETATSVLATASVGTGVVENVPHAVTKSENNFVMSSRRSSDISTIRGKLDDSESGIADIIYSQDLIARDKSIPCTVVTSANNRFINFKRFRKVMDLCFLSCIYHAVTALVSTCPLICNLVSREMIHNQILCPLVLS